MDQLGLLESIRSWSNLVPTASYYRYLLLIHRYKDNFISRSTHKCTEAKTHNHPSLFRQHGRLTGIVNLQKGRMLYCLPASSSRPGFIRSAQKTRRSSMALAARSCCSVNIKLPFSS